MNIKASKDLIRALEQEEAANKDLHPYYALRKIALNDSPGGPSLSLRIECWMALLRTRLATRTSSQNSSTVEGALDLRPAPVSRLEILSALASATPEVRNQILSGRKLLEGVPDDSSAEQTS